MYLLSSNTDFVIKVLIAKYKELCESLDIEFDNKMYIDAHLNYDKRYLAELYQIKPIRSAYITISFYLIFLV